MELAVEKFIASVKDLTDKKVLLRVDYNVPTNEKNQVTDDLRIRKSLTTLAYLLSHNCKIIIIAHKGRPKGIKSEKHSLRPIADCLKTMLNSEMIEYNSLLFIDDCLAPSIKEKIAVMKKKDIIVLDNLRFYNEETSNDMDFARKIASYADIYVSDAFGAVHKNHASIAGITKFLPYYYGFLIKNELESLNIVRYGKKPPLIAIIGGSKISTKITVLHKIIEKAEITMIGGAMAYNFLKVMGKNIGNSIYEADFLLQAENILKEADKSKSRLLFPSDHMIVDKINDGNVEKSVNEEIPDGKIGVDIGPQTVKLFSDAIKKGKTIFWNGPLGIFEVEAYAEGTKKIAAFISKQKAFKVVGGGDSIAAIRQTKMDKYFDHMSTGGGASLEYVEGKMLPGLSMFAK